jgi:hypothetical protein
MARSLRTMGGVGFDKLSVGVEAPLATGRQQMPLYLCDWQDGEISLVQAANKDAANIDVLDALGSADPQHIRQVDDLAISLYYDPAINRVVAALDRYEDADRTNDTLRRALNLPDDYEDIIGFPAPLADTSEQEEE